MPAQEKKSRALFWENAKTFLAKARAFLARVLKSSAARKIREQPAILLPIMVLAALAVFFWEIALAALIFAMAALALLKLFYSGPGLKELLKKKRVILSQIEILEKNYLTRKLSKKDFLDMFRETQVELIGLEAKIDEKFNKENLLDENDPRIVEVAVRKRHIVAELLGEKKRVLKEMKIAERMYLKRKIDAAMYQSIINQKREKLVELEAELKQIYGEESIAQVVGDLKKRLAEVEEKRKKAKLKKRAEPADSRIAEIADEITKSMDLER